MRRKVLTRETKSRHFGLFGARTNPVRIRCGVNMDLTPTECLVCLALAGGITAFLTAPGTQALLREVALTIRSERREAERIARKRCRGKDWSPERE